MDKGGIVEVQDVIEVNLQLLHKLSVTESIIKYSAKKIKREKNVSAFEIYFFLLLFAVRVVERYFPDKLESVPILFR